MSRYGFNAAAMGWRLSRLEIEIVLRPLIYLALLLGVLGSSAARAQTPSPLLEWQYSGGIVLEQLFLPNLPDWQFTVGPSALTQPVYEGARAYRVWGAPVIDIRYKNVAFFSLGEGLGVNVLRGAYYRVGISLGFDLGRRVPDDYPNLHGLGDISVAPFVKLFGSYIVSKDFPMVIRIDVRRIVLGGADGALGDLEAYMPLPGSSKSLFMFAGPAISWADHRYLQKVFGVTLTQSIASGDPIYDVHSGTRSAGIGFNGTKLLTDHWLLNANAAVSYLQGSAAHSPVTEAHVQRALALSVTYKW